MCDPYDLVASRYVARARISLVASESTAPVSSIAFVRTDGARFVSGHQAN